MDYHEAQKLARELGPQWSPIQGERFDGYAVTAPIMTGGDSHSGFSSMFVWREDGTAMWWSVVGYTDFIDWLPDRSGLVLNELMWWEYEPVGDYVPDQPRTFTDKEEAVDYVEDIARQMYADEGRSPHGPVPPSDFY